MQYQLSCEQVNALMPFFLENKLTEKLSIQALSEYTALRPKSLTEQRHYPRAFVRKSERLCKNLTLYCLMQPPPKKDLKLLKQSAADLITSNLKKRLIIAKQKALQPLRH